VNLEASEPKPFDWAVRTEVYRGIAADRLPPSLEELAGSLEVDVAEVAAALRRLESAHQLALLPDGSGVWMANPFSSVPTAFAVETARGRYWANCAWDALGVPAILGIDGMTRAPCANTGETLVFGVQSGQRVGDEGIIHLVVPPRRAWDDIGFT